MPTRQEKLIQELVDAIEGATQLYNERLPSMQSRMYKDVLDLLNDSVKDLEFTNERPKRLKISVHNSRVIAKINAQLETAIINGAYKKDVAEFLTVWDRVSDINSKYFSTITTTWRPGTVFNEIKKLSATSTKEKLLGSGIKANVVNKLGDVLSLNITTGGTYTDFTEQVRTFLMNDDNGDGALARYSKTFVVDSINLYNAQYHKAATDDLGLEFYMYVGPLKTTSRDFCIKLIEAKKGCMPFIHRSQFDDLLKGNICGEHIHINDKTKLPDGLKAGTTPSNFQENRGGYSCDHQLIPVDEAIVPDDLVKKFKGKY